MTALAMAQDTEKSEAAGMNDHVTKPISPERLVTALLKHIRLPGKHAAAPRSQKAVVEQTQDNTDTAADLRALTSVDAREGVRRIGGKAEAYRRQLRRFREHYAVAASELRQRVHANEIERAEDYCHALKGVAGNIGADALFGALVAIDERLKRGEAPDETTLDTLELLLRGVIADIDSLDSTESAGQLPTSAPPRLSRSALIERLDRLEQSLNDDLGAVDAQLVELRTGSIGDACQAAIEEIAAKVDAFAIDDAVALVRALRQKLKQEN